MSEAIFWLIMSLVMFFGYPIGAAVGFTYWQRFIRAQCERSHVLCSGATGFNHRQSGRGACNSSYLAAVLWPGLGVTGTVQNAPNANSKAWYGSRTLQGYQSMLQTTDTEALSLSQWLVAHYGLPLARVRQMKQDSTINAGLSSRQPWRSLWLARSRPIFRVPSASALLPPSGSQKWKPNWGLGVTVTQQTRAVCRQKETGESG